MGSFIACMKEISSLRRVANMNTTKMRPAS